MAFGTLPPRGGTLTLKATATDTKGNSGAAIDVTVTVLDVVSPEVLTVTPSNGAVDVASDTLIRVVASEPWTRIP